MVTTTHNTNAQGLAKKLAEIGSKHPSLRHVYLVVTDFNGGVVIREQGDVSEHAERLLKSLTLSGHTNGRIFKWTLPRDAKGKVIPDSEGKYEFDSEHTAHAFRQDKRATSPKVQEGLTLAQKREYTDAMSGLSAAVNKMKAMKTFTGEEFANLARVFVDVARRIGQDADTISSEIVDALAEYDSEQS